MWRTPLDTIGVRVVYVQSLGEHRYDQFDGNRFSSQGRSGYRPSPSDSMRMEPVLNPPGGH